jgi:hypothetical protein
MSDAGTFKDKYVTAVEFFKNSDFTRGCDLYSAICREHAAELIHIISQWGTPARANHKAMVGEIVFQRIMSQGAYEDGFEVDLNGFLPNFVSSRPLRVGRDVIQTIDKYKSNIGPLDTLADEMEERYGQKARTKASLLLAFWVLGDLIDLLLLMPSLRRVVDIGSGSGLHATILGLGTKAEVFNLYEISDPMISSAKSLADLNGISTFRFNEEPAQEFDCMYSFKACGFLFSTQEYIHMIKKRAGANAMAMLDIGGFCEKADELKTLAQVFTKHKALEAQGHGQFSNERNLFKRS